MAAQSVTSSISLSHTVAWLLPEMLSICKQEEGRKEKKWKHMSRGAMCTDGRGGAWITYQIVGFGSTEAGVDD